MIGQTILHYKIIEELGRGGMGVVYKAEDTKLKREVAIKFLPHHISTNKEEKQRFEIEAQAAASLNHPNIATIHAIEEADNPQGEKEIFIVMEYIEGKELKHKISAGTIKLNEALDIAVKIAEGLGAAHSKGIVHRDIKSSNIMITSQGNVKIMDFGLAKVRGSGLTTRVGTTMGTAAYMSPEQATGEKVDHRTDIWSLGVILYELLTGELPFKADYEAAWTYVVLNKDPLKPSELDRKIPANVDLLVIRMLEKNRENRFSNTQEIIKELANVRNGLTNPEQETKVKAIAVLPFNNISAEKESDYFSDGLTEELIMNLSRLKDMRVVSRTTSMQYKGTTKGIREIGGDLGVRYIIEGSVRKFQDNLRITAQLIDVEKDAQLWAETYKGNLADVFDIQEKVSKQIVDALTLKLTPMEKVVLEKRSTLNSEAFDCYLRARDFLNKRTKNSINFAIQLFQKAIEIDPRYAGAYAGLGEAYATIYHNFESNFAWLDKAIESSLRAITYDSNLSEAYSSLALAYFYKKSIDEAFEAGKKAIELDPQNFNAQWILGRIYLSTDRFREAVELFKKVVELNPDFYSAYGDLIIAYERLGDKEKGNEALRESLNVYPKFFMQHPDDARAHLFYANALVRSDQIEKAKREAAKAIEINPTDPLVQYNVACFYALIGEKKLAVQTLKNAMLSGHQDYEWTKRDSDLDSIREEPEYIELMKGK
jgi:serine/threonine protein kinase/Tfp pilus assembly protein PilF